MRKTYQIDALRANQTRNSRSNKFQRFMLHVYIYITVLVIGAGVGGYFVHSYDQSTTAKTNQAIQTALKSVPVAQASASVPK